MCIRDRAWGANDNGQLGTGGVLSNAGSVNFVPHYVLSGATATGEFAGASTGGAGVNDASLRLKNVSTIAAGGKHAIALLDNGTVVAWGANNLRQLGGNTDKMSGAGEAYATTPRVVMRGENTDDQQTTGKADPHFDLRGIMAISAGDRFSLVETEGHKALRFGSFTSRDGVTSVTVYHPVYVKEAGATNAAAPTVIEKVQSIAAGSYHGVAATGTLANHDTAVWAWGLNTSGQLGNGFATNDDAMNTRVDAEMNATEVVSPVENYTPHTIYESDVIQVSAGSGHSVLYKQDGGVWDMGRGNSGQLGQGSFANAYLPVQVGTASNESIKSDRMAIVTGKNPASVVKTYDYAPGNNVPDHVTLTFNEQLVFDKSMFSIAYSDGFNLYTDSYRRHLNLNEIQTVTYTSSDETVGVFNTGLSDPNKAMLESTNGTKAGTTIVTITVLLNDGRTITGQVSVTFVDSEQFQDPMISAGSSHSAAVSADGKVYTWGMNGLGQAVPADVWESDHGANSTDTDRDPGHIEYPYHVLWQNNAQDVLVQQVQAGDGFTLAVDTDGKSVNGVLAAGDLWIWGSIDSGITKYSKPTLLSTVTGFNKKVKEVSVWGKSIIVLADDGTVWTNNSGVGGLTLTQVTTVPGNVKQVAAGQSHYVILANSTVYTWGSNSNGQLGIGGNIEQKSGVMVVDTTDAGYDPYNAAATYANNAYNISPVTVSGTTSAASAADPTIVQAVPVGNVKVVRTLEPVMGKVPDTTPGAAPGTMVDGVVSYKYVDMVDLGATALTNLNNVTYIAAGANTSAAVTSSGNVLVWGANGQYQAANGVSTGNVTVPTPVLGVDPLNDKTILINNAKQVSLGATSGFAVTDNGNVYAWGAQSNGQLGTGADSSYQSGTSSAGMTNSGIANVKTAQLMLKGESFNEAAEPYMQGVIAMDAGNTHTLVVRSDGLVFAAGSNGDYKLGAHSIYNGYSNSSYNNTTTKIAAEPAIVGDLEAKSIVVGQVDIYDPGTGKTEPYTYKIDNGEPVAPKNVVMTETQEARIPRNGLLETYLAGFNLMVNSRSSYITNMNGSTDKLEWVSGETAVATVTEATDGTMATVTPVGGTYGVVPIRVTNTISTHTGIVNITVRQDTNITNLTGIASPMVVSGTNFSAALRSDGTVWTWGDNSRGQLGDGTVVSHSMPTQVMTAVGSGQYLGEKYYIHNVVSIAAGDTHLVMVDNEGHAWTMGDNTYGQLGYDTAITVEGKSVEIGYHPYAKRIDGIDYTGAGTAIVANDGTDLSEEFLEAAAAGAKHTLLLTKGAEAANVGGSLGTGDSHYEGGEVFAFGWDDHYQLGIGTSAQVQGAAAAPAARGWRPVHVLKGQSASDTDYLSSIVAISAGGDHSVALRNDGRVLTWGDNTYGQLGDGTTADRGLPVLVLRGESESVNDYTQNVVAVAAGRNHTLMLVRATTTTDSMVDRTEVYAWGDNSKGQLGRWTSGGSRPEYFVPVRVRGRADSTLTGTDAYPNGYLGSNAAGGETIVAIAAGGDSSFAVTEYIPGSATATGKLYAWGDNRYGQLGITDHVTDGTTGTAAEQPRTTPEYVTDGVVGGADMNTVRGVGTNSNHTVILKADGTVWSTGYGNAYQSGDGTIYTTMYPVHTGDEDTTFLLTDQVKVDNAQYSLGEEIIRIDSNETVTIPYTDLYERYMTGFDLVDQNATRAESFSTANVKVEAYDPAGRIIAAKLTANGIEINAGPKAGDAVVKVTATLDVKDAEGNVVKDDLGANVQKDYDMLFRVFVRLISSPDLNNAGHSGKGQRPADIATPMVSGGNQHALALKADGTVWAWGQGVKGQLGVGQTFDATFPVLVHETGYICPGDGKACGEVLYESDATMKPTVDETTNYYDLVCPKCGKATAVSNDATVTQIVGKALDGVIAVAAGDGYSLALRSDGTVWAWGSKANVVPGTTALSARRVDFSQAKDESSDGGVNYPRAFIVSIAAGTDHALALDSKGTVWAWGSNVYGQLGDDNTSTTGVSARPVHVKRGEAAADHYFRSNASGYKYLDHVVKIAAGEHTSMALSLIHI